MYRKTPAGSRTGSQERNPEPKLDHKELAMTKLKSKGILKVQNETESSKTLHPSSKTVSDKSVNAAKKPFTQNRTGKNDSVTSSAAPINPVKKSYQKI